MRWLHYLSICKHRSRLPWREARRYTRHWQACRLESPMVVRDPERAKIFQFLGYVTLGVEPEGDPWRIGGSLDTFLTSLYGCPYSIFFGKTYASGYEPVRTGSQLWHADGGPGTCVIVMIYRTDVTPKDGPLQLATWEQSRRIFRREPSAASRESLCAYYEAQIGGYREIVGPRGTMIAFTNNTLHRGGYPDPGHSREVSVYHVYPAVERSVTVPEKTENYMRL